MLKQNLGKSAAEVSELTLGTWVFGGDGWSGAREQESLEAVACALDLGITTIDTAPVYGNGTAEEIVGKAVEGRRDQVFIATKCGLVKGDRGIKCCLKGSSIREEIEESLRRLRTDYVDLYQCHWPDNETPIEETMTALNRLKQEGKIRYIGVSNFSAARLKEALAFGEVASNQVQYSMLDRSIEPEMIGFCRENGVGILAYGPLAGGVLSGKYHEPKKFPKGDARNFFYKFYEGDPCMKAHKLLRGLKEECRKPLAQIAINWIRQQPGVSSVLIGCRNAQQVQDNAAAVNWQLKDTELEKISDLLRETIPAVS